MQRSKRRLPAAVFSALLAIPAAAQNLLQNPGFATDLSGWTLTPGTGSIAWNALDADGSASSGSARLVTPAAEGSDHELDPAVRRGQRRDRLRLFGQGVP